MKEAPEAFIEEALWTNYKPSEPPDVTVGLANGVDLQLAHTSTGRVWRLAVRSPVDEPTTIPAGSVQLLQRSVI